MHLFILVFSFVASLFLSPVNSPASLAPNPVLLSSSPHTVTTTPPQSPTPTTSLFNKIPAPSSLSNDSWGVAKQIDQHTWQIRIQNDGSMGTPDEIFSALNNIRQRYGAQSLQTDPRLCAFAQIRAVNQNSLKSTDSHRGFEDYLNSQNGFHKLGFGSLGENSSYGYVMSAVHLIEFVYNSDPDHSKNQLNPKWNYGCAGVSGTATDLIFATSPF